jgi:hypothetical protein
VTVAIAVGILGVWAAWRRRSGPRDAARRGPPGFYRRALRAVARRGFRPGAAETAREFNDRVAALGPAAGAAFTHVTTLYERERFGGTPPSPAELEEANASLAALDAGRR